MYRLHRYIVHLDRTRPKPIQSMSSDYRAHVLYVPKV